MPIKIKVQDYTPRFFLEELMPDVKGSVLRSVCIKNFHEMLSIRFNSSLTYHRFDPKILPSITETDWCGVELETIDRDINGSTAKALFIIKESVLGDCSWHHSAN